MVSAAVDIPILCLLALAGLALNGLVFFNAAKTLRHVRVLHMLLLTLAACDWLALLLFTPTAVVSSALSRDAGVPPQVCAAFSTVLHVCMGVGVGAHCLVAASRLVLCRSHKWYLTWFPVRRVAGYLIGWVVVCLISHVTPIALQVAGELPRGQCMEIHSHVIASTVYMWPLTFFVPIYLTVLSYLKVYLSIRRVRDSGGRYKRDCREGRVTLLVTIVVCLCCWLPYLVVSAYDPHQTLIPKAIHRVTFYFFLTNTMINPLAYTFRSGDFKNGLMTICRIDNTKEGTDTVYNVDFRDLDEEFRERDYDMSDMVARNGQGGKKLSVRRQASVKRQVSTKRQSTKKHWPQATNPKLHSNVKVLKRTDSPGVLTLSTDDGVICSKPHVGVPTLGTVK